MCAFLAAGAEDAPRHLEVAIRYEQDRVGGRRDKENLDPADDERECPSNKENDMHRTMIATSTILLALATHAAAQDWPTRPMTLVVPFSAGGGVDVSARIKAQRMGELLGQTIIVENVGAAAGMTDCQPVGLVSESPRILVARKALPVTNLKELTAYIKANESKMQYGSAGVGSGTHLPCALFNQAIGANVTHVPYRGEGPVMQDLIGGRIDYMCATIQSGAAQSREGTVRGIAVMAEKRAPIIPDLATTGEQGLPGVEASVWNAFFLPKGTPDPIVRKLNKAMSDTVDDPAIRKRLEELGLEIASPERRSPEYLAKFLPAEIERWAKPIREGGVSAD